MEIDGYSVVTNIDAASIDPMATHKKTESIILNTDEWKARREFLEKRENFKIEGGIHQTDEWKKLTKALEDKTEEIIKSEAVYFEVGPDSILISEETMLEYKKAFDELPPHHKLLKDKSSVIDLRGTPYYKKIDGRFKQFKINKLGVNVPKSAKASLDPIEALDLKSDEELKSLFDLEKRDLIVDVSLLRSEKEMDGYTAEEAISETKSIYEERLAALKTKYRIE